MAGYYDCRELVILVTQFDYDGYTLELAKYVYAEVGGLGYTVIMVIV